MEIKVETDKDRQKYIEAMKMADIENFSHLEKLIGEALQESLIKIRSNLK